jgi:hypothetical protein
MSTESGKVILKHVKKVSIHTRPLSARKVTGQHGCKAFAADEKKPLYSHISDTISDV